MKRLRMFFVIWRALKVRDAMVPLDIPHYSGLPRWKRAWLLAKLWY